MTSVGMPGAVVTADGSGLTRRVVVAPGMCGGALFHARLGDWTWESVAASTGTNVYDARNAAGDPAYLSFYYFTVRGGPAMHPQALTFGDVLDVTSRCFDLGSESVLTLHRLARADSGAAQEPLEPEEFYDRPRPDRIYVQNFNRWISRGHQGSNEGLVPCSPVGFRHEHLPKLSSARSPRGEAGRARRACSFHPDGLPGYDVVVPFFATTRGLDVVQDLNGVGLTYFASFFSIVDTALHRLWREIGRDDRQFLARKVVDQRIGYYGNADIDAVFDISVRLLRNRVSPTDEVADVAVRDHGSGRLLAVAAIHILVEET